MPSDEIPDDLRDFIVTQIDSIAQLEALLLLKENPERDWTSENCASRLYIPETEAAVLLSTLAGRGFLDASENAYRFNCQTPEQADFVRRLAELYRQRLITVTNLIHSKQNRIQEFADAFRLRKDS